MKHKLSNQSLICIPSSTQLLTSNSACNKAFLLAKPAVSSIIMIATISLLLFSSTGCKKVMECVHDHMGNDSSHVQLKWSKAHGGTDNDFCFDFAETHDGAYTVTGLTFSDDGEVSGSHGNGDMWVYRMDRSGNIIWQKAIGGSEHDEGESVTVTPDNYYVVAGNTNSNDKSVSGNHGGQDIWVVKLDFQGQLIWQKTYGGSGTEGMYFHSIINTPDGGFMMLGYTTSNDDDVSGNHGGQDIWLVKIDGTGNIQWQKTYGGTSTDYSSSLYTAADGNYLIVGYSNSNDGDITGNHGDYDTWIAKVDGSGNILWKKTYGGSGLDVNYKFVPTADGGYILNGQTNSPNDGDVTGWHGDFDAWVVKIDANGNMQWNRAFGSSQYEDNFAITTTADGNYLLGAFTNGNDGDVTNPIGGYDVWYVKLSTAGDIVWQETIGGTGDETVNNILPMPDGSFLAGGHSTSSDGDVKGQHGAWDQWLYTFTVK